MEPEIDYYLRPEMSNSRLTEFKNILEGAWRLTVGGGKPLKAFDLGHLFHSAIFEPHLFDTALAACKNEISPKEVTVIYKMRDSAKKAYTLQAFLQGANTKFEAEYFFDLHGIPFKMKADAINHDIGAIGDGKSTAAKTYAKFLESCDKFGYWRQAVIYMAGTGLNKFYFWGVSKEKPYSLFFVDVADHPERMAQATEEVRWLCEQYRIKSAKAAADKALQEELNAMLQSVFD